MFGLCGNSLIPGAVGNIATRTTAQDIETYIQSLMPQRAGCNCANRCADVGQARHAYSVACTYVTRLRRLALEREPFTHHLLFLPAPLGGLCLFNGLDPEKILASEDRSCELICEWYLAHRLAGGEFDPVAERFVAEANDAQESGIAALQVGGSLAH